MVLYLEYDCYTPQLQLLALLAKGHAAIGLPQTFIIQILQAANGTATCYWICYICSSYTSGARIRS